jgi:hypothetical protein
MNEKIIKELLEEIAKYRKDIYADESCDGFPILSNSIDSKGTYVEWYDVERILRKRLKRGS